VTSLIRRLLSQTEARSTDLSISLGQWAEQMKYAGLNYGLGHQTLGSSTEDIAANFNSYVEGAYKANGIVFACCVARMLIFSEARFQYQRLRDGRPGDLFGTPELKILETPWANGTTGDLLSRAISDVDMAGNSYTARLDRSALTRMRPDWVTILLGSRTNRQGWEPGDLDTVCIGYLYHPGGRYSGRDPIPLLPEHVAHWAPIPDPTATYRGMSWVTPIVREIMGDKAAMEHKLQFFENGATVNLVVKVPEAVKDEAFKRWVAIFKEAHNNRDSAYDTVFMGGGGDIEAIGADMKQIDFKVTQGHGETRICAAARIPPIIVGLSEGLEAATYSNYGQARRAFADGTMRPLWRGFAGALASIVKAEPAARLWFDTRDISFLQEDEKDAADIQAVDAQSVRTLVDGGFQPETVVKAVMAKDFGLLKHSGYYSIQLQTLETMKADAEAKVDAPATDGQNGRRLLEQFVSSH
jgi:phage portal protein BeeE